MIPTARTNGSGDLQQIVEQIMTDCGYGGHVIYYHGAVIELTPIGRCGAYEVEVITLHDTARGIAVSLERAITTAMQIAGEMTADYDDSVWGVRIDDA